MFARIAACVLLTALGAAPLRAEAFPGFIFGFTKLTPGTMTFAVPDLTNNRLPASQTVDFQLTALVGTLGGNVTLSAPPIMGTSGTSISPGAWYASCAASSDPGGVFTTLGMVELGPGNVSCGNLNAVTLGQVQFTISLYLDASPDSTSFPADIYASAPLTVTVNAP